MEISNLIDDVSGRYRLKPLFAVACLLIASALVGAIATPTKFSSLISLVSAIFFYLIFPGYILLLNVDIDDIERIVLSTAVGIGLIPLILFNLNLFWFRISKLNVILVIIAVAALGILMRERSLIQKESSLKKAS